MAIRKRLKNYMAVFAFIALFGYLLTVTVLGYLSGAKLSPPKPEISNRANLSTPFSSRMLTLENRKQLQSRIAPNFTCSDMQKFQAINPKISIDEILDVILELLETEAYDPSKELTLTKQCQSDQDVFHSITIFLLDRNVLFYLLALFVILAISVLGEFWFRIKGSQISSCSHDADSRDGQEGGEMENSRVGQCVWITNMAHRVFDDIDSRFTGQQERDGLILLSFQLSLIAILIPAFLIVITVLSMQVFAIWNVIRTALCLWVVFFLSALTFHYHGSRNRISMGNRNTNRTLLISRISHDVCTEEYLRSYFQDTNADTVTAVSLIHQLMDDPSQSRPASAAFITFKTNQHAEKARKYMVNQPLALRGWRVDWAPPSSDIVWSNLHQIGSYTCLLKMIIRYFFGIVLPLAGSTMVVESLKLLVDKQHTFYVVLRYSKPILTLFFIVLVRVCKVCRVDHVRKSSSHLGLFFSTLVIIVVSEVVLPMLNFKDIWNSIMWTRTDPKVVNHWIRLQCIFRPDLGSEMAISVIEWNLFHKFFISSRVGRCMNIRWLRLTKSPAAEDPFPPKTFNIGVRYARLVAQFVMTCVGYFTYPPIVLISVICLVVGYIIDRYTMVQIYRPTYSGADIHRWAVLLVLLMLVIQSVLLFYKNVLMVEKELILVGDSAVITLFVGLHCLFCIVSIVIQFLLSSAQTSDATAALQDDQAHCYIPPPVRPHSGVRCSAPIGNTGQQAERLEQDIRSGSIFSVRAVCFTFLAPLIVTVVIVVTLSFTVVPKVAYSSTINDNTTLNHNLILYSGRVPYSVMRDVCQKDASWLTIESRCADILVDSAVRNERGTPFRKTDEGRRLLWTGGFYNLSTSDHWRWLDKNVKTEYSHFCFDNQTEIVAKAKQMGVSMLYIVKDYTGDKFNSNGMACWQVYSHDQLNAMGFSFLADSNPRLSFACQYDSFQK